MDFTEIKISGTTIFTFRQGKNPNLCRAWILIFVKTKERNTRIKILNTSSCCSTVAVRVGWCRPTVTETAVPSSSSSFPSPSNPTNTGLLASCVPLHWLHSPSLSLCRRAEQSDVYILQAGVVSEYPIDGGIATRPNGRLRHVRYPRQRHITTSVLVARRRPPFIAHNLFDRKSVGRHQGFLTFSVVCYFFPREVAMQPSFIES